MLERYNKQSTSAFTKWQKKQWPHEKSDKSSDKTNAEYRQYKVNEKGVKTGKGSGKHVINPFSNGISQVVKTRDVQKLQQDIKNDTIIRGSSDQISLAFSVHIWHSSCSYFSYYTYSL